MKTKNNPAAFQKALDLLKFANEKDLHFQDLAKTLKMMKISLARDLVRW